jgi:deoxyribodipyrimidine photo-lyase
VKAGLREDGLTVESHRGHLLFEPWTVETGTGSFYKVYTPFWRAVRGREVATSLTAPSDIPAPGCWPESDTLHDWQLCRAMNRGAEVCRPYQRVGEEAAQGRLGWFMGQAVGDYNEARDLPSEDGTSGLSENLALGEISPVRCWHSGVRAMEEGKPGAETWLQELVWREFAYHLMYHTPHITKESWRPEWRDFPWSEGEDDHVLAWKQGRTGVPFVDAAMREMYVTGKMHNRARMIVASYLTKHLMTHWRIGQAWFEDCLTDWDPASNAMGWQWSAGSGPDATPYFRIFNAETQAKKFDPEGVYLRRWIAERQRGPTDTALSFFEAVPRSWGLSPHMSYPAAPIVGLKEGRRQALDAYEGWKS